MLGPLLLAVSELRGRGGHQFSPGSNLSRAQGLSGATAASLPAGAGVNPGKEDVSQGGTFYCLFTWQILTLSSSVTERDSGIEQKLIPEFWLHNNLESI